MKKKATVHTGDPMTLPQTPNWMRLYTDRLPCYPPGRRRASFTLIPGFVTRPFNGRATLTRSPFCRPSRKTLPHVAIVVIVFVTPVITLAIIVTLIAAALALVALALALAVAVVRM